MEASGVSDALKIMKEENEYIGAQLRDDALRGPNGQPSYFTKENVTSMFGEEERSKIEIFERLQ
ncbi:hypothetical protein COOONC_03136, partial [Cooperia oncophora]